MLPLEFGGTTRFCLLLFCPSAPGKLLRTSQPYACMYTSDDITEFLAEQTGVKRANITPESRLVEDLGLDGDDFFELEQAFARRFGVDMSGYRWYFHHAEEGLMSLGGLLFPPPNARVGHIPITVTLLLNSANAGRWLIDYPAHQVPSHRYDLLANAIVVVAFALLGLFAVCHHLKLL